MSSPVLLVTVAHPDDESFGCGSVLLHAKARGWRTVVLCATRGEAGESRTVTDDLGAVRAAELHAAAEVLGVDDVRLLDGHRDGSVAADAVRPAIAAAVEELRPDLVVTLDASDGHPDHAAVRDATLDVVGDDTPTFLWCLPRSCMERWAAHNGVDVEVGTPDEEITHTVDVRAHLEVRWAAIRAHASQASPYDDLPADLQVDFLATDRYRHVRGPARLP
ncbi:MAG TPA: PIG-L deacetylase family protein [Acidimicrobiales bacterium]|nr:PIG-L deacetylase family protein [Acidimicrobiales bacterium]